MDKQTYIKEKEKRREQKRTEKRVVNGEEVIFIFEKVLQGWKTIRIYNTIIQSTPESGVTKKKVESISTGNCKIYKSELTDERYLYYLSLREKVSLFSKI
jgi:serine/threonine-protein kinase RIO1